MPTNCLKYIVTFIVIFGLIGTHECLKKRVRTKFKRKLDSTSAVTPNNLVYKGNNNNHIEDESGRGFFGHGLFALGKVLNFFPVGGERECQPSSYTAARAGICLNQYDCRQREGRAAGDCAHGLGVCCVFEVTCGGVVQNNLTYFLSPGFPELWSGTRDCNITVEKTHAGITQLRVDFVHFTIGQPNRTTGECDEDAMTLGEGNSKFVICGQNHGQHIYYTLPSGTESREAGDLPTTKSTSLSIRMRGSEMPRLWLMRLAQMPLAQAAPHDCLQYHTADNGTIQTFNFAINGRHLANQEYKACIRKNSGKCAVRYTPCDRRSFRIGAGQDAPQVIDPAEVASGSGGGQVGPTRLTTPPTAGTGDQQAQETQNGSTQAPMPAEELMPADDLMQDEEGSGADPQIAPAAPVAPPSLAARVSAFIWGFIWPSWLWGQRSQREARRWSPYAQHYENDDDFGVRYYGYGNYGANLRGYGRKRCSDRITIPCENEYLISNNDLYPLCYGNYGANLRGYGRKRCSDRITIPCENEYLISSSYFLPGVCDPHHCGSTLCPGTDNKDCHIESTITPFAVSVHFGPPTSKKNPEENIGACLRYTQVPCDS